MTMKHLSWLLLVAGAVIYGVEAYRGGPIIGWETKLPGVNQYFIGMGEYFFLAGVGLLLYQKVG